MIDDVSPTDLAEGLRTGRSFHPFTPGLKEAARELIRPFIERMDGQEIIYRCRAPWLLRITSLQVDDEGFSAVGTPAQEPPDDLLSSMLEKPLKFGARWVALTMCGSSISIDMIPDCFFPDPAVVSAVKAAAARGAAAGTTYEAQRSAGREINEILERASTRE
jgi:hypothetical protein